MKRGQYSFTYSQQYGGGRRRDREEDITFTKDLLRIGRTIVILWQEILTLAVFIGSYWVIPFEECFILWTVIFGVYSAIVWPKDFKIFLTIVTLVIGGLLSYLLYIIF